MADEAADGLAGGVAEATWELAIIETLLDE
jgi:hypothetical protein